MPENKITIIAESFEAAALEFHRSKLSSKGYRMDGKITSQKFEYMDGPERKDLFDGKPLCFVNRNRVTKIYRHRYHVSQGVRMFWTFGC